jgi:hypothetical protein
MPTANQPEQDESELISSGWKMATVSSGEHLRRTILMYGELGLQTKLVKVDPTTLEQCTACYRIIDEPLYKIYTRTGLTNSV